MRKDCTKCEFRQNFLLPGEGCITTCSKILVVADSIQKCKEDECEFFEEGYEMYKQRRGILLEED